MKQRNHLQRYLALCSLSFLFTCGIMAQIQAPQEFLSSNYGKEFTPHHLLVDYFQYVSSTSNRVQLMEYGKTNEGRPLLLSIISSPENINQIEKIRENHLIGAGFQTGEYDSKLQKSIVWLSYNVHGNEAGGSESSLNVIYALANAASESDISSWLENTIVIMDPCLNPDGYSRYTHWVRGVSGKSLHPKHQDREHMEPWPGGRVNHYLFDLNRDWAWQTQVETQQRITQYNLWMPHIHADLHEMGYDDNYYFAPAAEPLHSSITDWQQAFQTRIGMNHAKHFDEKAWLYFTREIFDLLYPSYGDTWPMFNGSIGMTYEQAGHGMAGRSIEMSNGKDLVLQDRIDHHTTTSLSTIETASKNQAELTSNFQSYFDEARTKPTGKYKAYIIKQSQLTLSFCQLLERNGIQFEYIREEKPLSGFSYLTNNVQNLKTEAGDIYISAFQSKSTLLQVLMEQEPILQDSITYDITSWCLPYAFGLDCYGFQSDIKLERATSKPEFTATEKIDQLPYAVSIPWNETLQSKKILTALLQESVIVKSVQKPITIGEVVMNRGDLVILKADQKDPYQVWKTLVEKASAFNVTLNPIQSGFAKQGSDLGGSSLRLIKPVSALTFSGRKTDANSVGQIWNYFENEQQSPLSMVDIDNFDRLDLSEFNTIILPNGWYSFDEDQLTSLNEWVMAGGKLISIASANGNFVNKDQWGLKKFFSDEEKATFEDAQKESKKNDRYLNYEGSERRYISGSMPGAIFETKMDLTHPLCFGIDRYYTLKTTSSIYQTTTEGDNPIYIAEDSKHYGFVGSKIENNFKNTAVFNIVELGSGKVIYMIDNPLFRGFWKNGELVFSNALFQL